MFLRTIGIAVGSALVACGAPPAPASPCFTVTGQPSLRAADSSKVLDDLVRRIKLSPEDEALREPRSVPELRAILRRDAVMLFANGAAFAKTLDSVEGRVLEAQFELLLGESQLVASQTLNTQSAWVGGDLRIARANLAGEGTLPTTDRGRLLAQLIRVVEEGNTIADALGAVAPGHLTRGAAVVQKLRLVAPDDVRTAMLVAEYHRLRGEWAEFDSAMKVAEARDRETPATCYLRGMEQLERFRRPDAGAQAMRQCLARFPKFVRAQAALVLMATRPAAAFEELTKLKAMNEDHYLVVLLEPTLAADRELVRMGERGRP